MAIPLFFKFLADKKSGNSDTDDRILLLNKFTNYFGKKCIQLLIGDREFASKEWIIFLQEEHIEYVIRIKENGNYVSSSLGKMILGKELFNRVPIGFYFNFGKRNIGLENGYSSHLSGIKKNDNNIILLAHSARIKDPCGIYKKRWQIEHLFKSLKTSGFNIEDTRVTDLCRLNCLFSIVCIAYCFAYKMGKIIIEKEPPIIKNHGYKPKSIVRYGLDFLSKIIRGDKKLIKQLCIFLTSFELPKTQAFFRKRKKNVL